jgi:hypothetical protein
VTSPPSRGRGTIDSEPICYFDVDMLGEVTRIYVTCDDGRCIRDYEPEDGDELNFLEFDVGTQVTYDRDGSFNPGPPRWIRMRVSSNPPQIPGGNIAVSAVYDFIGYTTTGLPVDSVFFDRTVGMQIDYDPDNLPDNATSVGIAAWDPDKRVWVFQPQATGRVAGVGTATADVTHFSTFVVMATTGEVVEEAPESEAPSSPAEPAPATFSASDLTIAPVVENLWGPVPFVTRSGREVAILATITNSGAEEGTYTAELEFDGSVVGTHEVELAAGQSQQVRFQVSNVANGEYAVRVANLSGEFTSSSSINWWLLGALFALAAAMLALYYVREQKRRRLAGE